MTPHSPLTDVEGEEMSSETPTTRELAARESEGLRAFLLRHPREDIVTVSVEDSRAGDRFRLAARANP